MRRSSCASRAQRQWWVAAPRMAGSATADFPEQKVGCWSMLEVVRHLPPIADVDLFQVLEAQQIIDQSETGDPSRSMRAEIQLLMKTEAVQLRFIETPGGNDTPPKSVQRPLLERKAERALQWLHTSLDSPRDQCADRPPSFQNTKKGRS